MKRKIITAASVCILVLAALVAKSESLLSANAKVIIDYIPNQVTCYFIITKDYSSTPMRKEYYCVDCEEYGVVLRESDDTCSPAK